MSHLISKEEMVGLTGAIAPKAQCEVLRRNGLRFTERADGRPALSWEAYNRQIAASIGANDRNAGPRLEAV